MRLPPATKVMHAVGNDPTALRETLDAWMPEQIAVLKVRGFVEDHKGDIIESVPGHIHVRFRGKTPEPESKTVAALRKLLSGDSKSGTAEPLTDSIDMHLLLAKKGSLPQTLVEIQVVTQRSPNQLFRANSTWLTRANQLLHNLRAYLMAK
jgi:serine/threonine-protein kinase